MSEGLEAIFFLSFSFFLVGSVGDVSTVLLACVLHALGTNPAAVRGFRNRFPKPNFEMMSARFQTSVPGYSRIVSCDATWSGASCAGLVTYNLVIPTYAVLAISEVRKVITIVISSVTRKQFSKITSFCTYTSFSLKKEIFLLQFCCFCVFKAFFCALFF